jgi:hypothetical protein
VKETLSNDWQMNCGYYNEVESEQAILTIEEKLLKKARTDCKAALMALF